MFHPPTLGTLPPLETNPLLEACRVPKEEKANKRKWDRDRIKPMKEEEKKMTTQCQWINSIYTQTKMR